ncbi:hypothetical protein [Absidia glauca]|uniref:Uncharacterized protein n=1 Tax=Absidia glauca TaxID=4829 RepID=A0A168R0S5_ABSGL|nr:hypothetical protein [Absidia glauca]
MTGSTSFIFASKSGRKISLENASHPCPQCKSPASVQLTRSERQLILLNRRIKDTNSVRYECNECGWKNAELPTESSIASLYRYLNTTSYTSLPSSDNYSISSYSIKTAHSINSCHY